MTTPSRAAAVSAIVLMAAYAVQCIVLCVLVLADNIASYVFYFGSCALVLAAWGYAEWKTAQFLPRGSRNFIRIVGGIILIPGIVAIAISVYTADNALRFYASVQITFILPVIIGAISRLGELETLYYFKPANIE